MATANPNEYTSRRDRRQSAPETTFRETEYIDKLSKNRTAVIVKLIDGEEVHGWIEYYDKDIIRITRATQPTQSVYLQEPRLTRILEPAGIAPELQYSRNAIGV